MSVERSVECLVEGNRSTWRKPASVPLRPPQIPHDLSGVRTTFRKFDLFQSSGDGREAPSPFGPLEEASNYIWLFLRDPTLPSPEDGNRSNLRNVVLARCLEFRTMAKIRKPSDSE
jgi:hypothetical protein